MKCSGIKGIFSRFRCSASSLFWSHHETEYAFSCSSSVFTLTARCKVQQKHTNYQSMLSLPLKETSVMKTASESGRKAARVGCWRRSVKHLKLSLGYKILKREKDAKDCLKTHVEERHSDKWSPDSPSPPPAVELDTHEMMPFFNRDDPPGRRADLKAKQN